MHRVGGLLGTSAAAHARECASRLRGLAAAMGTESLGTQWRSPAKDRCEAHLWEMEEEVRVVARRLELWADTEGSQSLMTELL
ncbi:MAG: hypothetical protein ACJAV4_000744 [Pontimonas sp.]|jgi:hypothetical protein